MSLYIFVAPHLDDIALSCGGFVHRLTHAGERAMIVTVCTADVPLGTPLSPSAEHEHWQWQLGDQPYQKRCIEDDNMAARLGAGTIHLGLLDAIYRKDDKGVPLYVGKEFIGGKVHDWDWEHLLSSLVQALHGVFASMQVEKVFCPLTAGGHVDHVLTRRAIEQLCPREQLWYYEDYPYAQKDESALASVLGNLHDWRSTLIQLTPEEIDARIAAIACYQSQMFAVFGSSVAMPGLVREYVSRTGGERYWERVE